MEQLIQRELYHTNEHIDDDKYISDDMQHLTQREFDHANEYNNYEKILVCEFKSLSNNISLTNSNTINELVSPNNIVIDREDIIIEYNYPLSSSFKFVEKAPNGKNFTECDLIKTIMERYNYIYSEEEKTTTIPIGSIPNSWNRNTTNGTYGIWGHHITDLCLHSIYYDEKLDIYYLGIDS